MNMEIIKKILSIDNNLPIDQIVEFILVYLRKSRKDADYFKDEPIEKTLERHEEQLQEWSINTFGIKIPEKNIFREVVSGDTIEDRPKMQELLNKIESDNVKAVLCIEIERLARGNTIDQGIIAQSFKYSNTKIITPYKIYDLDNEDDLSYFEDGLFQSRKYLQYVKKILKRGRIRSVKEGKYISSHEPYGYKKKKLENEKGYTLEINEDEAKIINLIADLYAYGIDTTYKVKKDDTIGSISKIYSMKKSELISNNADSKFNMNDVINIKCDMGTSSIATYLNYLEIKPKKNKYWTPNMIRNILSSPTIYGYVTWGKRQTVSVMKNGELVKTRPNSNNYIKVKGKFKPILDENDERTKIIINKKNNLSIDRTPNSFSIQNPLAGIIKCPICNKNMIRRPYNNRNRVDTLYCKTARCKTVGSDLHLVEERLIDSLKDVLKEYKNYVDNYNEEYKKEINKNDNLMTIIDNELNKANNKLERCYDLLEDGTYGKDIFNKRVDKLKIEINNLNERKKEIKDIDIIKKYEERKKAIPLLKIALDSYSKCDTIKQKNDLLHSIIDYVIYEKTKGGRGYEDKFKLKIKLKI